MFKFKNNIFQLFNLSLSNGAKVSIFKGDKDLVGLKSNIINLN